DLAVVIGGSEAGGLGGDGDGGSRRSGGDRSAGGRHGEPRAAGSRGRRRRPVQRALTGVGERKRLRGGGGTGRRQREVHGSGRQGYRRPDGGLHQADAAVVLVGDVQVARGIQRQA